MNSKTNLTTLLAAVLLAGAPSLHAQNPPLKLADEAEQAQQQAQRQAEQVQNRVQEVQEKTEKARRKAEISVLRANQDAVHFAQAGEFPEPPPRIEAAGFDWTGDGRMFDGLKESFALLGGSSRASAPIVVTTSALDPEIQSGLREDLLVMSRILSKSVEHGRDNQERVMGITVNALASARRPQAMYLEGHGVVFLMNVPIALVPPAAKEEEKASKAVDNEWERTKRELYGTRPVNIDKSMEFLGAGKPVRFDAEKVESLKRDVLEALKNGANLRQVKPSEFITVVLSGGQGSTATVVARVNGKAPGKAKGEKSEKGEDSKGERDEPKAMPAPATRVSTRSDKAAVRESTMTIRVKKADADAYAKGTLSLEDFTKKATIAAY